jgi:CHAT domain-containing protein
LEAQAIVYMNLFRHERANELFLRALEIMEELGLGAEYIRSNLAENLGMMGQHLRCIREYQRWVRESGSGPSEQAYVHWVLGQNYAALHDWESAEASYRRSLELAGEVGDMVRLGVLEDVARMMRQTGRTEEAEEALRELLAIVDARSSGIFALRMVRRTGFAFEQLGNQEAAREAYSRVAEEAGALGARDLEARGRLGLVHLDVEAGALDAARGRLPQVIDLVRGIEEPSPRATSMLVLGQIQWALGDVEAALDAFRAGAEGLEPSGGAYFEAGQSTTEFWEWIRLRIEDMLALLHELASGEGGQGEYTAEGFRVAQSFRALGVRALLPNGGPSGKGGVPEGLTAATEAVLRELSGARKDIEGEGDPERRRALGRRIERLEDEHDLLRARMRLEGRASGEGDRARAVTLEEAQGALHEDAALLQYFLGEERTFLWVVTKREAAMVELAPPERIEGAVEFFRKALAGREPEEVWSGPSEELYSMLVAPALPHLEGVTTLLVVPDRALHLLPFEALVEEESGEPLMRRWAVGYLPATALLGMRHEGPVVGGEERKAALLLVADPALEPQVGGFGAEERGIPEELTERGFYERGGFDFHPLGHARREARRIGRALRGEGPTTVLMGKGATEERVKGLELHRYSVIHFATHGISDPVVPMRSAVVLGPGGEEDGFLQVREIYGLELDAELVVLSGCETGRGKLVRGEGVVGLGRAFLAAGARSLAVSLWRVDDRSTALLMERFYRDLAGGMGKAEALREAKEWLRSREGGRYEHPYYWAPFVLIGEPG